eukprot:scaffold35061_cov63-Phaeocystis_antarctica.AAC.3
MATCGSSTLRSWLNMMPASSPPSFESAIGARAVRVAAALAASLSVFSVINSLWNHAQISASLGSGSCSTLDLATATPNRGYIIDRSSCARLASPCANLHPLAT